MARVTQLGKSWGGTGAFKVKTKRLMGRWSLGVVLLSVALTGSALATGSSNTIGRSVSTDTVGVKSYRVATNGQHRVQLILRPSAYTSGDRKLVELQVVNSRILFDPDSDYTQQGGNPIDENHHLLAAQRLYRYLTARNVYTIRAQKNQTGPAAGNSSRPRMIIFKPGGEPSDRPTPAIPRLTEKTKQVARN